MPPSVIAEKRCVGARLRAPGFVLGLGATLAGGGGASLTAAAATRRSSKVPAFASKMSAASRGVVFAERPRNSRSAPFEARLTTTAPPFS